MYKKSDFLIRGIILLSIFLIFSFFDTQAHSIPLKPDIESNQSPKRLMGLEKKVNPVTSRIINSKPEDNAETISSALLCPKKNNPEKNHSSNTVIKTAAALAKEIGIPSSYFDTNRILQITNDKLHVVIGFHSSFILDYSDYKSYVLESNLKIVRTLPEINAIVVEVDISALKLFLNSWNNLPFIRYLELAQITSVSAITDDPDWDIQYGPQIIQTDLAWDIQKGDPSTVLIAVIDTGIDYTHPDLADQYITGGYDYVNNDWDPMDDHSHGTHCAGTIGATINNSIGIAGVANVSIMGYKVFNSGGFGFDYDAADAIINATNFGADILSNSYGFPSSNPVLADAVAYAAVHDVVIVVSAGNSGAPVSSYPALYPETITVSATDDSDTPASFTSYGSAVDVAAPGVDIWSTLPVSMGNYGYKSGTSMACPHVAGVCALIRAQFPSFTADQVRQHLRMSADDLGSIGWDDYYGYGRVNAFKAVQPPPQHELVTYLHGNPEAILPGETIKLNISVYNYGQENETDIQLQLWINDTLIEEKTFTTLNVGDNGSFSYSWSPSLLGTYNISVYASPVLDETYTANNRIIKYVYVRYPIISYDLGDFIEMNFVADGTPIINFTYTTEIDPTHIRIDFGNGYDWFIVNTLTRYISSGTTWVGYYYMGQIETGLKIGDSVKWYATTGIVNNTVYYNWDGMLLEAWNLTIAEGVFAYYHKTTGIWLYYNEFGTEIEMVNTSFIVWQPPEHELRASLRAPGIIPVNNATFVNVTVYNEGRNNETNVEVQLWINDSMESSQIFLSVNSGTEVTLSYSWRPLLNGVYNITAYVIPVVNETLLFNNFETIFSLVQEPSDYLIIQDANPWNFDWTTLLGIIGITYDIVPSNSFGAMNLSFYGRIIIPSDQPQEFYTQIENQMSILEGFVQQGGILEVHATDQGENEGMWEGFLPNGISYISVESNSIEVEDPSNLLLFHPYVITKYDLNAWGPAVGGYLANIGNANVILTSLSQPIMIELAVGEGYYLITTQTLELGYSYAESRFFENLLQYNPAPPPHEIGVGLECASLLPNGTSVLLNATLANHGISTEANVYLEIWINDTLYVNNSYPSLIGMSTELVQYEWNPIKTGFYNITVFAPPVIGEVTTLNNYLEASCLVKYLVNYTLYETEFGWFDAYANGYNTNLTGDDTYYALNLPFPFFYYDVNFTSIYISSNGWFSFTDSSPTTFSNPTFPTASFPYAIAVFWDDLQCCYRIPQL